MKYPFLDINIDKIEKNTRIITEFCRKKNIDVAGVTKVVCGLPKVARAMIRGGVTHLADSRLSNIYRMREDGIRKEIILLRLPMLSKVLEVVKTTDISLNSEITVIKALSEAALQINKKHKIILMIDLGDLREGILPKETYSMVKNILALKGVELHGIGTNLACLSGIQPDIKNMELLVHIAHEIRKKFSIPLPVVSGGNTFSLPLLLQGKMPEGINHLRLGASLIMNGSPTPAEFNLHSDTIRLHAEILELKEKPSIPFGESGEDAFGKMPVFEDKGVRKRAILGIGKEDITPEALFPVEKESKIVGASSDHLIIDVTGIQKDIAVGDEMEFSLEYGAVLAAMTSKYVHKNIIYEASEKLNIRNVTLIGAPYSELPEEKGTRKAPEIIRDSGLIQTLTEAGLIVNDFGDIKQGEIKKNLSKKVAEFLKKNEKPLLIGGSHSIIHEELKGIKEVYNEFGLICFDAHGDLILSILADESEILGLSLENFVIIGVRSLTPFEKEALENSSITVFSMEEIDKLGMVEVMKQSLDLACSAVDGIHVSIDMDFVDIKDAPGVVQGEPGGLSYREAHLAMEMIAESKNLLSMDITEIDPSKDLNGVTVKLAISLISSLLGKKLLKKR